MMISNENNGYDTQNDTSRPTESCENSVPQEPQSPRDDTEARRAASQQEWQAYASARKESPYADSPYMDPNYHGYKPEPPRKHKPRKEGVWGKRVVAGVLCASLVAAGCGITAAGVNHHWNNVMADTQLEFDRRMDAMQKQINAGAGTSVSGSPVTVEGSLTPGQIYAQNVSSVVTIHSFVGPNQFGQMGEGSGSGFILSEDGYIVTNHHVIEGADQVSVITSDGTEYPAEIVGSEASNDVAVLKVDAQDLPAATIGTSSDLIIGDMVVAIGNPLGTLAATQTVGYICGKDRDVSTDGSTTINMLQTDAAINPGNSGGPLFNMKGEVIGITTAKFSGMTNSGASIEGIGFAIPIDDVMSMVEDLVQYGYVTGAYLGVTITDMDREEASKYGLPVGAYVVSVVEEGSAARAGLQAKDIIVGLGDYEIENCTDLMRALRHYKAGETATISYVRGGSRMSSEITFDERPQDLNKPAAPEAPMPSEGDYDEWYEFFRDFFGSGFGR